MPWREFALGKLASYNGGGKCTGVEGGGIRSGEGIRVSEY